MSEWVTCLLSIQKVQVSYASLETCYPGAFSGFSQSLLANVGTFLKLIEKGVVNVNFSLTIPSFDITHMRTCTHTKWTNKNTTHTRGLFNKLRRSDDIPLDHTVQQDIFFSQCNITKYYDFVLLVSHKFPVPGILQVWSSQAMQELDQDV
jgi:hypothetical protein